MLRFKVSEKDVADAQQMARDLIREMTYAKNIPEQLTALAVALGAVNEHIRIMAAHGFRGDK